LQRALSAGGVLAVTDGLVHIGEADLGEAGCRQDASRGVRVAE
jgi:hypothetical protein